MTNGCRNVLTLDLGTKCGWALMQDWIVVASGTLDLSFNRETTNDYARINKFCTWLAQWAGKIDEVVYEEVAGFQKSMASAKVYYNLQGFVEKLCGDMRIERHTIHVQTLKAQFANSGRASKEDMARMAESLGWRGAVWGTKIDNDGKKVSAILNGDEADAIALAFVHGSKSGHQVRLYTEEEERAFYGDSAVY